ncbi:hypothetical protein IL306_000802 [Fusarium sp. DS 682]|nr:hypothetical protein IL306_000802 [Fusarium sp. DS 682]
MRTSYSPRSDEQFQHAVTLVGSIAQVWADREIVNVKRQLAMEKEDNFELAHISTDVDTRPNEDFVRRYQNDILEDQQLDGASVATARGYFNNWIASKNGCSNAGDMRYMACIMLDAETLAQLSKAPKDLPRSTSEHFRSAYWVKMVEAQSKPRSGHEDAFRVLLFGKFDLVHYWFDRNTSRVLVTHRKNPNDPKVLYYGPKPQKSIFRYGIPDDAFRACMHK